MMKKNLISLISFFALCVAILCSTVSCSSQKLMYDKKKSSGYNNVRDNKPKWSGTQNSKKTKYVIKNHKRKTRPAY